MTKEEKQQQEEEQKKEEIKKAQSVKGIIHGYTRNRVHDERCMDKECGQKTARAVDHKSLFLNRKKRKPEWICGVCARRLNIIP